MIRAAYWTCALLALAHARIYERCELARELQSLGVDQEDISTWVCITYHESRFDTAAQNGYSGDHGLFQISELYWCGPGKACGLPCSALRDEDISDDLECALRIREEHNRLQGDGFLAWVVYPQHCKHNTKKYIVDCDSQVKNATLRTPSRSRSYSNSYIRNATFEYNPNIDDLKPPYLTVNAIVREGYAKMLEDKKQKTAPFNWLNYKIDNIDELTIPAKFDSFPRFTTTTTTAVPTTSTTTTTTTAYPPIKVWRRIETNQFRKKQMVEKKPIPPKWLELGKPSSHIDFDTSSTFADTAGRVTSAATTTGRPSTTEVTTLSTTITTPVTSRPITFVFTSPTTIKPFTFTTTTAKPPTTTVKTTTETPTFTTREFKPFVFTTPKPITRATEQSTTEFVFTKTTPTPSRNDTDQNNGFKTILFGYSPEPKTTFNLYQSTTSPFSSAKSKPWYTFNSFPSTTTTTKPSAFNFFPSTTSTTKPSAFSFFSSTTIKPRAFDFFSSPTTKPHAIKSVSTTTTKPSIFNFFSSTTTKPRAFNFSSSTARKSSASSFFSSTTTKPIVPSYFSSTTTKPSAFHYLSSTTATVKPSAFSSFTQPSSTTRLPLSSSTIDPPNAISNPFKFSKSSRTSRLLSDRETSTSVSSVRPFASITKKPFTTLPPSTTSTPFRSVTQSPPTAKTSQSIFDLYLSPTQWPKLSTRKFPELANSAFKLKIFSGGTTPAPRANARPAGAPLGGEARNYVRRQTLHA